MSRDHPIVFFDGDCGLCSRAVRFMIRRDKHARLRFAPLLGPTAQSLGVAPTDDPADWSLILYRDGVALDRSAAAVRIAAILPWPWRLAAAIWIVPKPLRDALYRAVARRRHRLFGRSDVCGALTDDERSRLLDLGPEPPAPASASTS